MKNIVNKVLLLCGASMLVVLPACDFLEPDTKDIVFQEDYFKNYHDANASLQGAYAGLQAIVDPMFVLGETRADLVKPGAGATEDIMQLFEHRVTPNNKYTDWSPFYDLVNRANFVLANLPKVENSPFYTQKTEDSYVGEMLFLRSLAYFKLIQNWGDVPLILKPTTSIDQSVNYPAVPQRVVLDTIINNLNKASRLVEVHINEINNSLTPQRNNIYSRTRGVVASVNALRAEVYLWRYSLYTKDVNDLKDADDAAQLVYNNVDFYELNDDFRRGNWFNIFRNSYINKESIMEIPFQFNSRETNSLQELTSRRASEGGKDVLRPSDLIIDYFKRPERTSGLTRDFHRGFGSSYDSISPTEYEIWKFIGLDKITRRRITAQTATFPLVYEVNPAGRERPFEGDAKWYLFRTGSLQLIRAEIRNLLGDRANSGLGALFLLNRVHNNRAELGDYPGITATSSGALIEEKILREKAAETAFEGNRWTDLLRAAYRRTDGPAWLASMVTARVSDPALKAAITARLADKKNWYLPYNAKEVALNPALVQK